MFHDIHLLPGLDGDMKILLNPENSCRPRLKDEEAATIEEVGIESKFGIREHLIVIISHET